MSYSSVFRPGLFKGQVVVVTGGGGGMGLAFCSAFAREGARVVAVDRYDAAVKATCDAMAKDKLQAQAMTLDVGDAAAVKAAFQEIASRHGRIDVLVNGAGIRPVADMLDQSAEEFEACMRVNTTGVFLCAREAARHMLAAGRGSIVNIASVNGVRAVTGTMGAVAQMTRELSTEWAGRGVRVNAILPAQVLNPGLEKRIAADPPLKDRFLSGIPSGRLSSPDDIRGLAVFLASDASSWITGQVYPVNGGFTFAL